MPLPDPNATPTLSVAEAAAVLGISRATAYRAVKTGELPALFFGKRVRISTVELLALLGLDAGQAPASDDGGGSGASAPPALRRIEDTG